jgi:hypothetical protein
MQDWLFFSVGPDMDWAGCIQYIICDQRELRENMPRGVAHTATYFCLTLLCSMSVDRFFKVIGFVYR